MDVNVAKFFLDALKLLRDVFTGARDRRENMIASGTFLELYGSATRLQGYAQRIDLVSSNADSPAALSQNLRAFFGEVHNFGKILRLANLSAIEIFHPQLAEELGRVVGADADLLSEFANTIAPRYDLKAGQLVDTVRLYVDNYQVHDGGAWAAEREIRYMFPYWRDAEDVRESADVQMQFELLAGYLQDFRDVIAEVIRTTWDFKELATLPPAR